MRVWGATGGLVCGAEGRLGLEGRWKGRAGGVSQRGVEHGLWPCKEEGGARVVGGESGPRILLLWERNRKILGHHVGLSGKYESRLQMFGSNLSRPAACFDLGVGVA